MKSVLTFLWKLLTGQWVSSSLSFLWVRSRGYVFPTGQIPRGSDAYLHVIEMKLSAQEKELWAKTRKQMLMLVAQQADECGLGVLGIERLRRQWAVLPTEEVMQRMKAYPPAVRAWLFQQLKTKPNLREGYQFLEKFMKAKDPIIAEALAYALCFAPTATNAADTLVHFPSPSTITLVMKAFEAVNPEIAQLMHRLVYQEMPAFLTGYDYYIWGCSYDEEGKYTEAIEAFSAAIAKGVKRVALSYPYVFRARCRLLSGEDPKEANADIESAVASGMPRGEAYLWVAKAFTKAGIAHERPDLLKEGLEYFDKASRYLVTQQHQESLAELYKAHADALVHLGHYTKDFRYYIEADEDYIRLIRLARLQRNPGDDNELCKLLWEEVIWNAQGDDSR